MIDIVVSTSITLVNIKIQDIFRLKKIKSITFRWLNTQEFLVAAAVTILQRVGKCALYNVGKSSKRSHFNADRFCL